MVFKWLAPAPFKILPAALRNNGRPKPQDPTADSAAQAHTAQTTVSGPK